MYPNHILKPFATQTCTHKHSYTQKIANEKHCCAIWNRIISISHESLTTCMAAAEWLNAERTWPVTDTSTFKGHLWARRTRADYTLLIRVIQHSCSRLHLITPPKIRLCGDSAFIIHEELHQQCLFCLFLLIKTHAWPKPGKKDGASLKGVYELPGWTRLKSSLNKICQEFISYYQTMIHQQWIEYKTTECRQFQSVLVLTRL